MRRSNFALRLQPSLMEEARKAAESEGVALNQLINVAVAEKISALRTEEYFQERIRRADRAETLRILDRAGMGNPPREDDELPVGGLRASPEASSVKVQPSPTPDREDAPETKKVFGRATPQLGQLKKRLDKMRPR
jgi:hypothetical protein